MKFNSLALKGAFLAAASSVRCANAQATSLVIQLNGAQTSLAVADQVSYNSNQDQNMRRPLVLSADGTSVTVNGNLQRALPFPSPLSVRASTTLEFDFALTDIEEVHAICIEEDVSQTGERCFIMAGTQDMGSTWRKWPRLEPQAVEGGATVHYTIPLGKYFWGEDRFNYLVFLQDNDSSDRNTGSSTYSNIQITDEGAEPFIMVNGSPNLIDSALAVSFDNSQDQNGRRGVVVSADGSAVTLWGNTHRSFPFATPVTIDKSTDLSLDFTLTDIEEIDAICFTKGAVWSGNTQYCIVAAGTQTWNDGFHFKPQTTVEGTTTSYSIPIGMYYQGEFSHLTLMQDNDSGDRNTGESTWSNIALTQVVRPSLSVVSNGNVHTLDSTTQVAANSGQDTFENFLDISGSSITLRGNMHKSIAFDTPIVINQATQIDFDFSLVQKVDHHSICVITGEDPSVYTAKYHCFTVAGTQLVSWDKDLEPKAEEGQSDIHYNYPIGLHVPPGVAHYLVFVQDADSDQGHAKSDGECTFSNIEFSQLPDLNVNIQGTDVGLFNYGVAYARNQDTTNNLLTVSDDGSTVSMSGNTWKAFEFPTPITVTDDTVFKFTIDVEDETEIHAICLEEDLSFEDDHERCFKVSGTQSNVGLIMTKGIKHTYNGEKDSYMIKMTEYNTGVKNYIVFINDNDGDKVSGVAHFSDLKIYDVQESCLKGSTFDFTFEECTVDNFIANIETVMGSEGCAGTDPWEELLSLFDLKSDVEVRSKIEHICASAYVSDHIIPFDDLMEQGTAFLDEFWDGGTTWNYEIDGADGSNLRGDASRINVVNDRFDGKRGIAFPDVHNFHGCELRAAMCCYVANRSAGNYQNTDNSDACYMEFKNARQSSHVRDGYSIYGDGSEGDLTCHGFAWGNDSGLGDAAFKGNTLFNVAMMHGLYTEEDVEELPGAPMCGCVEQMPVVTKADCTKTTVTQSVSVEYTPDTKFVAEATVSSIAHEDCGDLSTHYATIASEREQALLAKHLVGEGQCRVALSGFLETKGFRFA